MNPLQEYPKVRQWAYRVLWIVGVILGAIQVFAIATDKDAPWWVAGAVAVLGYVSIATNYTADRNVAPTTVAETPPEDRGFVDGAVDERGEVTTGLLATVCLVIIAIAAVIYIVTAL